jgi:hypothetical protein
MMEAPYQNPQQFMYCGELIDKDYYIAKVHWLRASVEEQFGRTKRRGK